jgi:hypothetical protein
VGEVWVAGAAVMLTAAVVPSWDLVTMQVVAMKARAGDGQENDGCSSSWKLKHSWQWAEGRMKRCRRFKLLDRARRYGHGCYGDWPGGSSCECNRNNMKSFKTKAVEREGKEEPGRRRHLNSFLQRHSKSV